LATSATLTTGDGQYGTSATSGTAIAVGGAGVGTVLMATASGVLTMGGTAGALAVSYAQNSLDATNSTTRAGSRLHVWKVT
jgi:hypothetical protein